MRNYMKLLICGGVVDIDVNVDNGHEYILVLIMVMLLNNHDDACWITMMKMLVNYIFICAYMLLVNFLTCYWWWLGGVSMYWNMLMTLIELWLVDGVDVNTWWCNWWWINQCKWRCTFTLMLVNTYVRWFCIVESLLVCPCIIVMLSHMWNVKRGVLLHRWIVRGGVLLHVKVGVLLLMMFSCH